MGRSNPGPPTLTGTIIRLHRGVGVIAVAAAPEQDEIYRFVRASVSGLPFDKFAVGDRVRFTPIRLNGDDALHRGVAAHVQIDNSKT